MVANVLIKAVSTNLFARTIFFYEQSSYHVLSSVDTNNVQTNSSISPKDASFITFYIIHTLVVYESLSTCYELLYKKGF